MRALNLISLMLLACVVLCQGFVDLDVFGNLGNNKIGGSFSLGKNLDKIIGAFGFGANKANPPSEAKRRLPPSSYESSEEDESRRRPKKNKKSNKRRNRNKDRSDERDNYRTSDRQFDRRPQDYASGRGQQSFVLPTDEVYDVHGNKVPRQMVPIDENSLIIEVTDTDNGGATIRKNGGGNGFVPQQHSSSAYNGNNAGGNGAYPQQRNGFSEHNGYNAGGNGAGPQQRNGFSEHNGNNANDNGVGPKQQNGLSENNGGNPGGNTSGLPQQNKAPESDADEVSTQSNVGAESNGNGSEPPQSDGVADSNGSTANSTNVNNDNGAQDNGGGNKKRRRKQRQPAVQQ